MTLTWIKINKRNLFLVIATKICYSTPVKDNYEIESWKCQEQPSRGVRAPPVPAAGCHQHPYPKPSSY